MVDFDGSEVLQISEASSFGNLGGGDMPNHRFLSAQYLAFADTICILLYKIMSTVVEGIRSSNLVGLDRRASCGKKCFRCTGSELGGSDEDEVMENATVYRVQ